MFRIETRSLLALLVGGVISLALGGCGEQKKPEAKKPAADAAPATPAPAEVAKAPAQPPHPGMEIQWWHSMQGALGERVNDFANKFNASQKDYKVVAVYKGQYPVSMTAAIAAFRAGNAPHILQVFEVGTATMMAAKGAIVPVATVMRNAKEPFDPKAYLPTVAGYYTDLKGNMLSFPFNSSTALFYINKDAFRKAGLEPKAPKTWNELSATAAKLKAAGPE